MTEKEKEMILNQAEAAIACGGGKMTSERRRIGRDILDGKMTSDEAVEFIKKKYGAAP